MEAYKERMIEEYKQLKDRYTKLHRLLVKYDAGTLNFNLNCPVPLLREQKKHMGNYLYCLEVRAEIEEVPLEDICIIGHSGSGPEPIDIQPGDLEPIDPYNPIPVPKPIKPIEEEM